MLTQLVLDLNFMFVAFILIVAIRWQYNVACLVLETTSCCSIASSLVRQARE
jgi:hypothetical protein